MYNFEEIAKLTAQAKAETKKPSIIILTSIIGKGAPNKQNKADIHGAPLGADEVKAARTNLGITGDFYIAPEAQAYFAAKQTEWKKAHADWQAMFDAWSKENPEKRKEWDKFHSKTAAAASLPSYNIGDKIATRTAGNKALGAVATANANLVGGSADLKGPNAVGLPADAGTWTKDNSTGRYIHFGIREFAMAAICNGISLHGGLRSYCSTFMVFVDYLRPALRMSALMNQPVVYVLTHDSILVGEDGPTHQPIEHLASMRVIPNVLVLRPGDAEESAEAWAMAMENTKGPTVITLSRQNITVFPKADPDWRNTIRVGAYIAKQVEGSPDIVIIATGSEVGMALEAAAKVSDKKIRVVSMISKELFESQPAAIRDAMIPPNVRVIVSEAGVKFGWERWAKPEDIHSIDRFGESGPAAKVAEHLGMTVEGLLKIMNR
jgi:transketolase